MLLSFFPQPFKAARLDTTGAHGIAGVLSVQFQGRRQHARNQWRSSSHW